MSWHSDIEKQINELIEEFKVPTLIRININDIKDPEELQNCNKWVAYNSLIGSFPIKIVNYGSTRVLSNCKKRIKRSKLGKILYK